MVCKKLDPEATLITRGNGKNTDGGPKEYHMENSFALASFAASSQYGRLLQATITVWMRLFAFLWLLTDESNFVFFEISKISDSEILDNLSPVENPWTLDFDIPFEKADW